MQSNEIRRKFLEFFEKREHAIIPSASLVTGDEKGITNSTLFNTAGMQPLIPYLLGKPHPMGKRLANVQKCLRTVDIDSVGDATHATFFEMLGNWSLGDPKSPDGIGQGYFKEEAIKWSFEFLTSKEEGLGLDPVRLYITCFEGDENAPRDGEAFEIWKKYIPAEKIYFMGAESNWWEAGDSGPCGPDTEMFYDAANKFGGKILTKEEFQRADENREVVEIWNDVFLQYEKKDGKIIGKLPQKCVDTGAGLERLTMALQGAGSVYDTDIFSPIMEILDEASRNGDIRAKRIIADHVRAGVFLISDGVIPSNTDRGYVLRRLIRRTVRFGKQIGLEKKHYQEIIDSVAQKHAENYSNILQNVGMTKEVFNVELEKFEEVLERGIKEFEKGADAFTLFSSYGFPLELTIELAKEKGIKIDEEKFREEFRKHQELSRAGAEQKFKGGLADPTDAKIVRYHTATHLLNAALRKVLGPHVFQKGSNITSERTRFDFTHGAKMTDEEKKKVEELVNEWMQGDFAVEKETMPKEKAEEIGAIGVFGEKYPETVSVYSVKTPNGEIISREFCGGPHVSRTSEIGGIFKIAKEEANSAGVRRIKGVLE